MSHAKGMNRGVVMFPCARFAYVSNCWGKKKKKLEMLGIEPGASHMRSERSTTELHPLIRSFVFSKLYLLAPITNNEITI